MDIRSGALWLVPGHERLDLVSNCRSQPSSDVSTREVIDSLKMAFMGVVQLRNGPWGVWNDLFYANVGGSKMGTRNISIGGRPLPIGVDADLGRDAKTWIWTVAGTYAIKSVIEGNTDMMFGMRTLDMTNSLDWSFRGTGPGVLPPRTGNAQVSDTLWDGIVGLKGRALVGDGRKWFVPFYIDVGTGRLSQHCGVTRQVRRVALRPVAHPRQSHDPVA